MDWLTPLLQEWFADTRANPDTINTRLAWWFGHDDERDEQLRQRFLDVVMQARAGKITTNEEDPQTQLGLILLTDQLPRNLFRGTPEAFSSDQLALERCLQGHRTGLDQSLKPVERMFFWMPLQHAEDLDTQELSVMLFSSLSMDDPAQEELWQGVEEFAQQHHNIIEKFGRFPHRNDILGRQSTQDELDFLNAGGARFGQ